MKSTNETVVKTAQEKVDCLISTTREGKRARYIYCSASAPKTGNYKVDFRAQHLAPTCLGGLILSTEVKGCRGRGKI